MKKYWISQLVIDSVAIYRFSLQNNGALPMLADVDEIKKWLNEKRRSPNEQNFNEALGNARIACQPVALPPEVISILDNARGYSTEQLIELWSVFTQKTQGVELLREKFRFWVTAKAIAR